MVFNNLLPSWISQPRPEDILLFLIRPILLVQSKKNLKNHTIIVYPNDVDFHINLRILQTVVIKIDIINNIKYCLKNQKVKIVCIQRKNDSILKNAIYEKSVLIAHVEY